MARDDAGLLTKKDAEHDYHRQFSVLMTNDINFQLTECGHRREIESGAGRSDSRI